MLKISVFICYLNYIIETFLIQQHVRGKSMILDVLKSFEFSNVAKIKIADIEFEPPLIELCKLNSCGNYGKNYTCPPLVGESEDLIKEAKNYDYAYVFQKVYSIEDSFDIEGMNNARIHFRKLTLAVNDALEKTGQDYKILSAGGCSQCNECGAVTNTSCRFPKTAFASLEAYCINVSKLAGLCDMKYINGQNTVTYFGAVLFNK